jgi:hypothetical protein
MIELARFDAAFPWTKLEEPPERPSERWKAPLAELPPGVVAREVSFTMEAWVTPMGPTRRLEPARATVRCDEPLGG